MKPQDDVRSRLLEKQRRVFEVLDEAVELPTRDRVAFLDRRCGDDPWVHGKVHSLLAAQQDAEFLAHPVLDAGANPGTLGRIGPYQLISLLGAGGMGEVYKAEREDPRKQVALKLIRRGLDPAETVQRFHSERQILANLDHPYIARVLDGGTTEDGRPYLVMEYIEGKPLDRYCADEELSIAQRLDLFIKICSAVELSHQKLIAHLDLKPGNILVTPRGDPKLLDFGIAKLLQPSPAADPVAAPVTSLGQRPMTLRYASPEQAGGERVATTSDIYSLGVLLYELLSGQAPYQLDDLDREAAVRVIREQEPEKPSAVVERTGWNPDASGSVGHQPSVRVHSGERRKRRRRLAGDLDSIVCRAIHKQPRERYSSVQQLAEDIRRHLKGLPVTARPDTFTYTASKFIRRNTLAVAVTTGVVLLSSGFGLLSTILWQQAEHQRHRAEIAWRFVTGMIQAAEPDRAQGENLTVVELLDIGRERIARELAEEPELQIEMVGTLGGVFRQLGEYDKAQEMMEDALMRARRLYPGGHKVIARRMANLAVLLYDTGSYKAAESHFRAALAMGSRTGDDESVLVKIRSNLASTLMLMGEFEQAEKIYLEALAARRQRYSLDSPEVATSKGSLGILYHAQDELEQAEPLLREALEIRRRAYGDEDTRLAPYFDVLGRVLAAQGRTQEAERLYDAALTIRQRRLPENHPHLAQTRKNLASLLIAEDSATAQVLLIRALETFYQTNPESWQTADAESVLGAYLTRLERYQEAESCLIESYESLRKIRGEQAIYTRIALDRLKALYEAWGRPE